MFFSDVHSSLVQGVHFLQNNRAFLKSLITIVQNSLCPPPPPTFQLSYGRLLCRKTFDLAYSMQDSVILDFDTILDILDSMQDFEHFVMFKIKNVEIRYVF